MDKERRKKIQTTKLVITEIFMLIIIVLTVIVLTFIVMGYRLTEDGKLEQSGLVQIDSIPTGAKVAIGEETLPGETNISKILPEGNYELKLTKDGYTTWSKSISVHPGLLTKLSYPRLYKLDRKLEEVIALNEAPEVYSIPPTREFILLTSPNSPKFQILNIPSDTTKVTEIDLSKLLLDSDQLVSNIQVVSWCHDANRFVLSFKSNDGSHLAIVDLERPENSLDLTSSFAVQISDLQFANNHGDELFILENGHLRTISLSSKQLSDVLVSDVQSFSSHNKTIALVRQPKDKEKEFVIYNSDNGSSVFLSSTSATTAKIAISEYLNRPTLVIAEDDLLSIYRGDLPTENITKDNPDYKPAAQISIKSGAPDSLQFHAKNQAIIAIRDQSRTVFDLESATTTSYTIESNLTFWPDEYTIGTVSGGSLNVRDYDGGNLQTLSRAESGYPAVITKDNKYIYFVQKNEDKGLIIVREIIK
ncbi:PEGA domain-containing protein [Candidatus Saccharibacteria bacterium]|nr:PEGA domain-containing protein [Candidatus Saccharibacteria bacterium]